MSRFTELHDWCVPHDGIKYLTTKYVDWEIGRKGSGYWVSVPTNFVFDVSVPKALRWLIDPSNPKYLSAACLHDYALHELGWDRVSSAAAFSEALRANEVPKWTRLLMVLSVTAWNWV